MRVSIIRVMKKNPKLRQPIEEMLLGEVFFDREKIMPLIDSNQNSLDALEALIIVLNFNRRKIKHFLSRKINPSEPEIQIQKETQKGVNLRPDCIRCASDRSLPFDEQRI